MSTTGSVRTDSATVLALYARQQDDRVVLSRTVRAPRKATRYHASSVTRTIDPSIMHGPITDQRVLALRQDGMGGTESSRVRKVVVRGAGGAAGAYKGHAHRLTDFHGLK